MRALVSRDFVTRCQAETRAGRQHLDASQQPEHDQDLDVLLGADDEEDVDEGVPRRWGDVSYVCTVGLLQHWGRIL